MVRFLRNATVAKVAGGDSSLLQISSDERKRVARVAELFSEEDLARHLQIMLRTHGELGYRQEQRFHLELGLLKMAHAQRLLPIEQLLSETAGAAVSRPAGKPGVVSEIKRPEASATSRPAGISPFAADSARKAGSKPELSAASSPAAGYQVANGAPAARVVMGSAAPAAVAERNPEDSPETTGAPAERSPDYRGAVLNAVDSIGQRMLSTMLEAGEWRIEGNELVIQVAQSPTVIEMSLGADARRLIIATASGALGRPMKLRVISGATQQTAPRALASGNGGNRGRAEQDPVVRRMKEKFGAEIRTIIDYKEKR
jgi:DNA polymerase-3 subunit gamma/tau